MADRKSRSVTFTTPPGTTLKEIRDAISTEIGPDKLRVLQQLTNGEYLIETTENHLAEELIDNGFDCQELHISCHPPRGQSTNVSIMGLRAYIADDDILTALRPYGEIKGEVIRLKYKADHDLAGLENGNRLVRMILTKPSIPYSLKIADEWCRIIHTNQQAICHECHEIGHSRRHCPQIVCHRCSSKGHLSRDCDQPPPPPAEPSTQPERPTAEHNAANNPTDDDITEEPTTAPQPTIQTSPDNLQPTLTAARTTACASAPPPVPSPHQERPPDHTHHDMDLDDLHKGQKRAHTTDSDSDTHVLRRRGRLNPSPNLSAAKPRTATSNNK